MNISRYNPWSLFTELEQELDRLAGTRAVAGGKLELGWAPAVDVREEPDRYVLLVDVPGIPPEQIQVTMDQGILTIGGERHLELGGEHSELRHQERMHGRFERRFTLPEGTDAEQVQARGKDGVLAVVIPKKATAQARRIEVHRH